MDVENMILDALELAHRVCIRKGVETDGTLLSLSKQHPGERHPCHNSHRASIPSCCGRCIAATLCPIEVNKAEEYQEHDVEYEEYQEDYHKKKHSRRQAPDSVLHLWLKMVLGSRS